MALSDIKYPLNKDDFVSLIVEKLGNLTIDFSEKIRFIQESRKSKEPMSAAGVLLLLNFSEKRYANMQQSGDFSFLLIKRSTKVAQPGDLSCPGGMLNRFIDPLLTPFLTSGAFSIIEGTALDYLKTRDDKTFKMITLFLTNAIRETWEEINIRPSNIVFLGPLPTHTLLLFRRMIFPLVGYVKHEWSFHKNSEVDRIVEIPLKIFLNEDSYGMYHIELPETLAFDGNHSREFPCLIYQDDQGHEEILWGATFYIIITFLKIVLDLKIPEPPTKRIIKKVLHSDYLSVRQN